MKQIEFFPDLRDGLNRRTVGRGCDEAQRNHEGFTGHGTEVSWDSKFARCMVCSWYAYTEAHYNLTTLARLVTVHTDTLPRRISLPEGDFYISNRERRYVPVGR